MKTCKERNIFEDAKPAKEYPADWFVIPALDVGRYIKQNTVSLPDFEAYKNKVKQAIEQLLPKEKIMLDKSHNPYGYYAKMYAERLKKLLEL